VCFGNDSCKKLNVFSVNADPTGSLLDPPVGYVAFCENHWADMCHSNRGDGADSAYLQ
jgi:hypothetical protein